MDADGDDSNIALVSTIAAVAAAAAAFIIIITIYAHRPGRVFDIAAAAGFRLAPDGATALWAKRVRRIGWTGRKRVGVARLLPVPVRTISDC
jgi:hypothetical protein